MYKHSNLIINCFKVVCKILKMERGRYFISSLLFCKNDKPGSVTLRYRSMLVIYLAPTSRLESSSLPITKVRAALCVTLLQHLVTYLALQHIRFTMPCTLLHKRWSLKPPFHPYQTLLLGGIFSVALAVDPTLYWVSYQLGSMLLCVARTFLF